jgi:hypothetical protein
MVWQVRNVKSLWIREATLAEILFTHEPAIRLGAFVGIFAAMALWELLAPRRSQTIGRLRHRRIADV